MRLRWTPNARADLHRLWCFAADRDVPRADHLIRETRRRVTTLAQFRGLGRPIAGQPFRELSLTDIQYVIRYRIDDDEIVILRVHHTRENRSEP